MCSGLLMASKTRWRGASNRRVSRISRSDGVVTSKVSVFLALPAMSLLLRFQLLQIGVEAIEPLFPDRAKTPGPLGGFFQRGRLQPARAPLRVAPARDESRPFEDPQVLRDRRHAHGERLGQFRDRPLA